MKHMDDRMQRDPFLRSSMRMRLKLEANRHTGAHAATYCRLCTRCSDDSSFSANFEAAGAGRPKA